MPANSIATLVSRPCTDCRLTLHTQTRAHKRKGKKTLNSPLSPHCNNSPLVSLLINLLIDLRAKRDSRHNTIPKLLVQDSLVRIPIIFSSAVSSFPVRSPLFIPSYPAHLSVLLLPPLAPNQNHNKSKLTHNSAPPHTTYRSTAPPAA